MHDNCKSVDEFNQRVHVQWPITEHYEAASFKRQANKEAIKDNRGMIRLYLCDLGKQESHPPALLLQRPVALK